MVPEEQADKMDVPLRLFPGFLFGVGYKSVLWWQWKDAELCERWILKGQKKRNRSRSSDFLFLSLPTFWKAHAEKPWSNLRNMVLSLTTPFPWKTMCQCCRNPSFSCAVCTDFTHVYPGMTSQRQDVCCGDHKTLIVILSLLGLQLCSTAVLESWERTPTSLRWIAVIKLPLSLLYVGSLKKGWILKLAFKERVFSTTRCFKISKTCLFRDLWWH